MTVATPDGDAAWTALLPAGTVWLSRPPRGTGAMPGLAAAGFAAPAAPWSLRRWSPHPRPGRRVRVYVAVPSRRHPLIVASWDRSVLRYLADTVLSVPPGTGQLLSAVVTVGLRLFRYRWSWLLAVVLRVGGAVLVGRAE